MARRSETGGKVEKPREVVLCRVPGCTSIASQKTKANVISCTYHAAQAHKEEVDAWLLGEGVVTEGMTKGERMKAMAAYRKRIRVEDKPDPLDWARRILQRTEDGDFILPIQERMAKQALGVE